MKRLFPALLAVMIICASLAMAVPASASTAVLEPGFYLVDLNLPEEAYFTLSTTGYNLIYFRQNYDDLYVDSELWLYTQYITSSMHFWGIYEDEGISYPQVNFIIKAFSNPSGNISVDASYTSPSKYSSFLLYVRREATLDDANFLTCFTPVDINLGGAANIAPDISTNGVYPAIYDILSDAFYGDGAELSGDQTLVLTVLATLAIVFMFAIPFLVVWLVIRIILGFFGDR